MDDDRLAMIGLASKGFGGGDPDRISRMGVKTVLDLVAYVSFERDFEETKFVLNKPEGS